jgi:hypothetical protein
MITKDPTSTLNKYILTPSEIMQAKLLGPETQAYLEHVATEIAETLLTTKFSHEPTEREGQIMQFVYLQAKREMLIELLSDCSATFNQLANLDSTNLSE